MSLGLIGEMCGVRETDSVCCEEFFTVLEGLDLRVFFGFVSCLVCVSCCV
mgnify:CR=1 FL=1